MSEWLKEHAWKACVGVILLPWVRIPLSPPLSRIRSSSDGESGIQALRGSRRSGLESQRGVGFRRSAAPLAPLRARIPALPRLPLASGGIQALRGAVGARFVARIPTRVGFRHSAAPLAPLRARIPTRVGFRHCAALAAPGSNPGFQRSATARLRSLVAERVGFRHCAAPLAPLRARIPTRWASGTARRRWRRFGHESPHFLVSRSLVAERVGFRHCAAPLAPLRARIPGFQRSATSRFRWSVAERVGFRHSAALAAPGTNPNAGGLQALRGSRRFGHESPRGWLQALRGAVGAASGTNPNVGWGFSTARRRWRRFGHESLHFLAFAYIKRV